MRVLCSILNNNLVFLKTGQKRRLLHSPPHPQNKFIGSNGGFNRRYRNFQDDSAKCSPNNDLIEIKNSKELKIGRSRKSLIDDCEMITTKELIDNEIEDPDINNYGEDEDYDEEDRAEDYITGNLTVKSQDYNIETFELKNKLIWSNSLRHTLNIVANSMRESGKNLNRGSVRLLCSVLRSQLRSKKNSIRNLIDHPGIKQLTESFSDHKNYFSIQELTGIISFLGTSEGIPETMTIEAIARLDQLSAEIDEANCGTLLSLLKSSCNIPSYIHPSLTRKFQDKVMKDLSIFTVQQLIRIINYFSSLKPALSDGMISLIFDKIGNNIDKLDQKSMYYFMRMIGPDTPKPTMDLQDKIYDRCMQLVPVMEVGTLFKFICWKHMMRYVHGENFMPLMEEIMFKHLQQPSLKTAEMLSIAYKDILGDNKKLIKILGDQLVYHKSANNRALSNCFGMVIKTNREDTPLLNGICNLIESQVVKGNTSFFAYCIWEMAEGNFIHPVANIICESLSESNTLSSADQVRTISSFIKLGIKPKEMISKFCKNLNIYDLDDLKTDHLVYFVDSLVKIKYKDRYVATGLITSLEKRFERFELSQKIFMMKGICIVGSASQAAAIMPLFEDEVASIIPTVPTEELTFLFELYGLLQNARTIKFTNAVFSAMKAKADEMSSEQLGRVMKWVGKANVRDQKLLQYLKVACGKHVSDMNGRYCSWTLWGFSKVEFELEDNYISALAKQMSAHLEHLNFHDISRFMFACAKYKYKDKEVFKKVSDYIINYKDSKPSFPGISLIAWSFATLSTEIKEILLWADWSSQGILNTAPPLAISNLLWSFRKAEMRPSESFLRDALLQFNFKMEGMSTFEFGTILYGLIHFNLKMEKGLIEKAIGFYETRTKDFDPNAIACATWCLTKLGYRPSKESIISSSLKILSKHSNLDFENLGNFLWACGKSGFKPTPLLEEMVPKFIKLADKLDPRVISSIIYGYASCQYASDTMLNALTSAAYDRMKDFNSSQIANMVWGLASLNFQSRKFYQKAAEIVPEKIDNMNTQEVLSVFWAFAKADRPAKRFTILAMARFSKECSSLDIQQLISLCWALGKVGIYDEKVMSALQKRLNDKFENLDVKGMSTVLWTFATLSHHPGDLVEKLLNKIGYGINMVFPGWLSLTHVLWSCSKFVESVPARVLVSGEEILERPESSVKWKGGQGVKGGINPKHIWLCLWSLYSLRLHQSNLAVKLSKRVNEMDVLENMADEEMQDFAQCLLMARLYKYDDTPLSQIPKHYVIEAMACYRASIKQLSDTPFSAFHRDVAAAIDSLGLSYEEKVILDDRMTVLDIWVPDPSSNEESSEEQRRKKQGLVFELYGPGQTINNTFKPTGKALLKTKLTKSQGFDVVTLIHSDWSAIAADPYKKQMFLVDLMKTHNITVRDDMIKNLIPQYSGEAEEENGLWIDQFDDGFIEDDAAREKTEK